MKRSSTQSQLDQAQDKQAIRVVEVPNNEWWGHFVDLVPLVYFVQQIVIKKAQPTLATIKEQYAEEQEQEDSTKQHRTPGFN